jgi:transcriptional regulator with XRE-family HTH domain
MSRVIRPNAGLTPFAQSLRMLRQQWNERHPFDARPMTQERLAEELGMDVRAVRDWEGGRRLPRTAALAQRICDVLEAPRQALAIKSPSVSHWVGALPLPANDGRGSRFAQVVPPGEIDQVIAADQQRWRIVRRYLNRSRSELSEAAAALYPTEARVHGTPFISSPMWRPAIPVPLASIALEWMPGGRPRSIGGTEPEAHGCLPLRTRHLCYDRYTSAMRYLEAPALFENRPSYRLLNLLWSTGGTRLAFGRAAYFDKLDVSETLGHEFAAAWLELRGIASDRVPDVKWRHLPFRRLIGDPFDLTARAVIPAITTLTLIRLRGSPEARFLLHWRDPGKVATAGGLYDCIPAGEFQPASIGYASESDDFDLWRNIVREYSEELLGAPEHDGSRSDPIDYDDWPLYRSLERARAEGKVRPYLLGVGCDALTLAAAILTVAVFDGGAFEELFGGVVRSNAEGVTVTSWDGEDTTGGVPFTSAAVERLLGSESMASPGAACLALALQHRATLL